MQSRLLRVLQEREITPVGSTETIPIDIRVIAATNKELFEEVKLKNFREDLYYRLNVMPIYSIPLRNRKEDIKLLLKYYLSKVAKNNDLNSFFTEDALRLLENYNWPGNIRELVNVVEYVSTIKELGIKIDINDLPKYIVAEDALRLLENYNWPGNIRELVNVVEYVSTIKELGIKIDINDLPKYIVELINNNGNKDRFETKLSLEQDLDEKELWVLRKIYKYEGIGRRTLSIISYEEGYDIGEGRIRSIMKKLRLYGYIDINKGLKGTKILDKGIKRVNL